MTREELVDEQAWPVRRPAAHFGGDNGAVLLPAVRPRARRR
jgi:hypothetical protein